jgi:hypothetical protein
VGCAVTTGDNAIMGPGDVLKESWEIVPILLLLSVGVLIAVKSGVNRSSSRNDFRQVAGNVTQVVLRLMGYVGALLALQYVIGLRPGLGW